MMYIAYYNPESKKIEVDTSRNYHEIKFHTIRRGFNDSDFKVIKSQFCFTKKAARKFEESMRRVKIFDGVNGGLII